MAVGGLKSSGQGACRNYHRTSQPGLLSSNRGDPLQSSLCNCFFEKRSRMSHLSRVCLVAVILSLLCTFSSVAKPRNVHRLPGGTWGGEHIRIDVAPTTASIEYDCATGTIAGPLTVNSRGQFTWRGSHSTEHGGPIRSDETRDKQAAVYTGRVKGPTMTLTAKLTDTNQTLGTFTLKRGSQGRVFKCR